MTRSCLIVELGLIGYADAYALQRRLAAARKLDAIGDVLLVCEHTPVITQGRNGKREHLLVSQNVLRQRNVEFFETSRGGDVTYHGPGQVVGYPILQLGAIRKDVVWYVRMLEEAMIRASGEFGVTAVREAGKTGIWVLPNGQIEERFLSAQADRFTGSEPQEQKRRLAPFEMTGSLGVAEKLGAIGVHISRWVTSHGFAYNVATDLRNFDLIVPCGIAGRKATSLEKLLGRAVKVGEVPPKIVRHFGDVFGLEMKAATRQELLEKLEHAEQLVAVPA
ncbi:MAG: lipoyl(octanoyl) transferase LipB [Candidatus Acidiferrum sp.]